MNRKSLGADIYSPIRFSASFNDSSPNTDGSISEFCSGIVSAGTKVDDEKLLKLVSDEDSGEFQKEKPVKKSKTADKKNKSGNSSLFSLRNGPSPLHSYKNTMSPSEVEDDVFTASINTESAENCLITVRRPSQMKEEKDSEKQSKERSASKKNHKKDFGKFITMRGDSRRSGDHKSSSYRSNIDILPTYFEDLEGIKIEVPSVSSSNDFSDKSKASSNSESSSTHLGKNSTSSIDCSTQTDLTLIELQSIINNGLEYSEKKEVPLSSFAIKNECITNILKKSSDKEAPVSKPAQIQANILEKLVRDVVDPECCEIRQILYLQYNSTSKLLLRILDELEEGRRKELLKENQQLRVENQQLRMENQQIRNENIQLRKIHFGGQ